MKLILLRNNLLEALGSLERAVGDNVNLPILKSVLVRALENKIVFVATNLELAIHVFVSGKIIEQGEVAIPFALLNTISKNLISERITLEEKDKNLLIITDNYEAVMQEQDVKEYPIIPTIHGTESSISVRIEDFKEGLQSVIVATQYSDIRPEISGVFFSYRDGKLVLVATDSFRLAERFFEEGVRSEGSSDVQIIIPIKTASELLRILKNEDGNVDIFYDANQMLFRTPSQEIISHLIDGKFPDYKAIMPKHTANEVTVNRQEFMNAVKLTSAFSSRINDLTVKIGENKKFLEIYSATTSVGENRYRIPAKLKGDAFSIVFNWRYLLDGLKVYKSEEIVLGVNANDKPAMLRSQNEPFLSYVIMPIRS